MPNQAGCMAPQSFCKHRFEEWFEILGSDMGLQELLIAFGVDDYKLRAVKSGWVRIYKESISLRDHTIDFDLTKNLHNQDDSFYEALLPLIK